MSIDLFMFQPSDSAGVCMAKSAVFFLLGVAFVVTLGIVFIQSIEASDYRKNK